MKQADITQIAQMLHASFKLSDRILRSGARISGEFGVDSDLRDLLFAAYCTALNHSRPSACAWQEVAHPMAVVMTELVMGIRSCLPSGVDVSRPQQTSSHSLTSVITGQGTIIATIDFNLVHEADAFGVSVTVSDSQSLPVETLSSRSRTKITDAIDWLESSDFSPIQSAISKLIDRA